jgi:hypothetical protein
MGHLSEPASLSKLPQMVAPRLILNQVVPFHVLCAFENRSFRPPLKDKVAVYRQPLYEHTRRQVGINNAYEGLFRWNPATANAFSDESR